MLPRAVRGRGHRLQPQGVFRGLPCSAGAARRAGRDSRPARVEEIRLTLRADFPHDSWWTAATAAFSDGSRERLSLRKTAAPQTFVIPPRTVTRLTLCELQKADDESPFPALTQLEVWGTDTPM